MYVEHLFSMWFIIQLLNSDDDQEDLMEELSDAILLAGCMTLAVKKTDRSKLVRSICHFQVIARVVIGIEQ